MTDCFRASDRFRTDDKCDKATYMVRFYDGSHYVAYPTCIKHLERYVNLAVCLDNSATVERVRN